MRRALYTPIRLTGTVVKWSYSRATFRSFLLVQSHSFSDDKSLNSRHITRETRASITEDEMTANQILPSAPQAITATDVLVPHPLFVRLTS
jgi:hypothetical protein